VTDPPDDLMPDDHPTPDDPNRSRRHWVLPDEPRQRPVQPRSIMVAGIILVALGLKKSLAHPGVPLAVIPSLALYGGTALYFAAHVAFRRRILGLPIGLKKYYDLLGPWRYGIFVMLLLSMIALPIKMVLRWLFNLKYIIAMPEIFFNI